LAKAHEKDSAVGIDNSTKATTLRLWGLTITGRSPGVRFMHDDVTKALVGAEVEQVWVWWSLRLVFDLNGTHVDVTNFRFSDGRGAEHHVRVEDDPEGAAPVLGLLHRHVAAAEITEWELRLAFDNGAVLVCPPDPRYEAWSIAVTGQPTLDCPPLG